MATPPLSIAEETAYNLSGKKHISTFNNLLAEYSTKSASDRLGQTHKRLVKKTGEVVLFHFVPFYSHFYVFTY